MRITACIWCRRLREGDRWTDRYADRGTLISTRCCPNCEVASRISDLAASFQTMSAQADAAAEAMRVANSEWARVEMGSWLVRARSWFAALPAGVHVALGVAAAAAFVLLVMGLAR